MALVVEALGPIVFTIEWNLVCNLYYLSGAEVPYNSIGLAPMYLAWSNVCYL